VAVRVCVCVYIYVGVSACVWLCVCVLCVRACVRVGVPGGNVRLDHHIINRKALTHTFYTERERERERETHIHTHTHTHARTAPLHSACCL